MIKIEYSACIFPSCGKPLGQDTKDLDFRVCHEHRICSICSKELAPIDVQICHDALLEDLLTDESASLNLQHARCAIVNRRLEHLDSDPTLSLKQSTYNFLNAARLMVDPDMSLSIQTNENNAMIRSGEFTRELLSRSNPPETPVHLMEFDAIYLHLKMLEACVANVNVLIAKQDRKAIKERADLRESTKFKAARVEAKTSARPVGKPANDDGEIELVKFMDLFEIKERKTGLELKKQRDKSVEMFLKLKMDLSTAVTMANKAIADGRQFGTKDTPTVN